jgi:hypothetical protein
LRQRAATPAHSFGGSAAAALCAVALWGGCAEEPLCDETTPLVDMEAFTLVEPTDDPFEPSANAALCTGDEVRAEPFGNGPVALDVDTNDACGWATVVQPSLVDLAEDDHVLPRVFYFSQQTFPAAIAQLAVRIGDETIWSHPVEIPTGSDVVAPELAPALQAAEGTPIYFHIGNHGANVWSLLELFRSRRVPCASQADAG